MNRESGHTSETSQEMHCMGGKWSLRFLNDWNYGGILTLQEVLIRKRGLRVKSSSCCVSDSFEEPSFCKVQTWIQLCRPAAHLESYVLPKSRVIPYLILTCGPRYVLPRIIMLCRCFSYHSTMHLQEARVVTISQNIKMYLKNKHMQFWYWDWIVSSGYILSGVLD